MHRHFIQKCHRVDRLFDIAGAAGRQRALPIADHGKGSDGDDRGVVKGGCLSQTLGDCIALDVRQLNVEQDEIGMQLFGQRNSLQTVRGLKDGVSLSGDYPRSLKWLPSLLPYE
jgi:hypothetical protein